MIDIDVEALGQNILSTWSGKPADAYLISEGIEYDENRTAVNVYIDGREHARDSQSLTIVLHFASSSPGDSEGETFYESVIDELKKSIYSEYAYTVKSQYVYPGAVSGSTGTHYYYEIELQKQCDDCED